VVRRMIRVRCKAGHDGAPRRVRRVRREQYQFNMNATTARWQGCQSVWHTLFRVLDQYREFRGWCGSANAGNLGNERGLANRVLRGGSGPRAYGSRGLVLE